MSINNTDAKRNIQINKNNQLRRDILQPWIQQDLLTKDHNLGFNHHSLDSFFFHSQINKYFVSYESFYYY